MELREVWGVPCERIEAFFRAQTDVQICGKGFFSFGDCEIRLTELPPRPLGRLSFPQTRVEFDGPEPDAEAIHRRFVLQFISAGG